MEEPFEVDNASLTDVQQALADGRTNSTALTQAYLTRIAAYDRAGASLNSVREVNPDALAIAGLRDGRSRRSATRSPASRSSSRITSRPPIASTPQPVPSPSSCTGQAGCDRRSPAARRRRRDPRQGEFDRIRQFHRD